MGKVTKKIRNVGLVLILCLTFSNVLFSQEAYNLSGTFEGSHIEFSTDGSNDSLVYFYKFYVLLLYKLYAATPQKRFFRF